MTGGAGFIGSHVVDLALVRGHELAVLDDLSSGRKEHIPLGVAFFHCDVRDQAATLRAFSSFRPDAVAHLAAQASVSVSMASPVLDATINVIGGLHVAEAARAVGCKTFVFASTGGAIYGNVAQGAADEMHVPAPISPYAINKLAFELLLGTYQAQGQLAPRILRYANVYGPRQSPHGEAGVVAIFLERAHAGAPLLINAERTLGDDGCTRDYVFVADIARANVDALEGKLDANVVNLGTGHGTTTAMLARQVLTLCPGSGSSLKAAPPRPGDVARSVLDGTRYASGHGPYTPLPDGLAVTAAWHRTQARA